MKLFESSILEKITNEEYERMFQVNAINSVNIHTNTSIFHQSLKPINLRMVKGAFFVLILGYTLAGLILLGEIESKKPRRVVIRKTLKFFNILRKQMKKLLFNLKTI